MTNSPLNLFENYSPKKGRRWYAVKKLLNRLRLALPWAILTGAIGGAMTPLLIYAIVPHYTENFGPLTCVGPMVESKTALAVVGLLQGGVINILLTGVVAGLASDPLPKRAMMITGALAGPIAWVLSLIQTRL
jgi:hypothetical protein